MKESDIEGLATHDGPESCAGAREGAGEALTGGVQAGLLSREITQLRGADAVDIGGRQHRGWRHARATREPRAVEEPRHARKLHAREPGEPTVARSPIRGGPLGEGGSRSPR